MAAFRGEVERALCALISCISIPAHVAAAAAKQRLQRVALAIEQAVDGLDMGECRHISAEFLRVADSSAVVWC